MHASCRPSLIAGLGLAVALLAACGSGSDAATTGTASTAQPSLSTSAASAMSAAPAASASSGATATSADPGSAHGVFAGCDPIGRGDVVIVLCGPTRFALRKPLARMDERAVRAELAKIIADVVPNEVAFEVREGALEDGTPALVAKASASVIDRKTSAKADAFFVAYGVKQPQGWGVIVIAAAPDERSAVRDAHALWSAPPRAKPFALPGPRDEVAPP